MDPGTPTIMSTDTNTALYRLLTWLSPAYPIGAFSYSQGLETAVDLKLIVDAEMTQRWLEDMLQNGSVWSDAVIFANCHKAADLSALKEINQFALALQPAAELKAESLALGRAFVQTTLLAWPCEKLESALDLIGEDFGYPCAVACAAAGHAIALPQAQQAWLHAAISNLISAAVRLVPLGQSDGQRILANLEEKILSAAVNARQTELADLATSGLMAEICAMRHETQHVRLFRS
ncbi:MAG: urease accessory protein UreF [Rhizobiales bacterium]|nr:urease accessory protein UreF [Hyphomicrobiales bacterium]